MRNLCRVIIAAVAVASVAGCSMNRQVPRTVITGSIGKQPFSISTPKDSELTGLHVSADTNGAVKLDIERLSATMNPTNIAATGAGEAAIIMATSDAIQKGIAAGATAAGAAMGAAAKAP